MKLKIIEEHDQIIDSIKEASTKTKGDFLFINIDSHSDMGFYDINEKPDIGTFIIYSVYQNFLKKYLWIKNKENINEFEDGVYNCDFWLDNNSLICNLDHKICYAYDVYSNKNPINSKNFSFSVISENNLNKYKTSNEKWLLSIDCDYFGCENPHKENYLRLKNKMPNGFFEKKIKDFSKIKDQKDYISFFSELKRSGNIDILYEISKVYFDEIYFSKDEILKKINLILNFIKKNFNKKDCLGIVLCKSESSGYVVKENLPFILKNLKKVFINYLNNGLS